jgi:hypothetical protein
LQRSLLTQHFALGFLAFGFLAFGFSDTSASYRMR